MRYFWGIIFVLIGFAVMKYAFPLVNTFGKIPWAENNLGTAGGTYLLYKLAGLVLMILAFLYMFNALDFLLGPLAPVFQGAQ